MSRTAGAATLEAIAQTLLREYRGAVAQPQPYTTPDSPALPLVAAAPPHPGTTTPPTPASARRARVWVHRDDRTLGLFDSRTGARIATTDLADETPCGDELSFYGWRAGSGRDLQICDQCGCLVSTEYTTAHLRTCPGLQA
jgi:hypothetical protein